ncbi:synaptotagmin-A-like [Rhinophrynus dorsalis]
MMLTVFSSFAEFLPFTDTVKYIFLALAIFLFLVALAVLVYCLYVYYKYRTMVHIKEKTYLSGEHIEKKPDSKVLLKTVAPSFLEIARKEQDSKIQLMKKEMEKLEVHLTPSPPSTESLDDFGSDPDPLHGSRGKLKFSLFYHKKNMTLSIKIIEAIDLPEHARDPFVKIKVFSRVDEQQYSVQSLIHEWETKVMKNNRNPVFEEEFSCSLKESQLTYISLKFEVKDFDKYSRHTLIGETRTLLKDLKVSETLEFFENLQERTKDIIGEVLVSLKCLPTSQKIEVGILKFKTSSLSTILERDVYARIDVFTNQHKQKHQKSSLRAKSKVTVFNETFLFGLPDPVKTQCLILISLYETVANGKKLIGQTSLGNQKAKSEDGHWELMMQSLRQPVAKWHPLFI